MKIGELKDNKIEKDWSGQGFIYKNPKEFHPGGGVCYVPELSDTKYTYEDFIKITKGDTRLAKTVFELVTWEHPEACLDQLVRDGII